MSTSNKIVRDSFNPQDYNVGSKYLESIKYLSIYDSITSFKNQENVDTMFPKKNKKMLYNSEHFNVMYKSKNEVMLSDPDPIVPPTIEEFYNEKSIYIETYIKKLLFINIVTGPKELVTKELLNINPICNYFSYFYSDTCFVTGIIDKVLSDKYKEITQDVSFQMILTDSGTQLFYNNSNKRITGGRSLIILYEKLGIDKNLVSYKFYEDKSEFLKVLNDSENTLYIIGYSDEPIILNDNGIFE